MPSLPYHARTGSHAISVAIALFLLCLSALAGPAGAVRLVVDPAGGGDFTTVQAGLDAIALDPAPGGDTLVVRPGNYAEAIHINPALLDWTNYILCTGGMDSTRVLDVTSVGATATRRWRIVGLSITNSVDLPGNQSAGADWTDCRFEGGYSGSASGRTPGPNLHHCELHGAVSITDYTSTYLTDGFNDLTFINATLVARNGIGGLTFNRCHFINSPGWAATFYFSGEYYFPSGFRDCTFEDCANGIDMPWAYAPGKENLVLGCRFTNIAGTGVRCGTGVSGGSGSCLGQVVNVSACHFDHCGQALDISIDGGALVAADTIVAATGGGIRARVRSADIHAVRVQGAGGDGISVLRISSTSFGCYDAHVSLRDGVVTQAGGHGIVVRDSLTDESSTTGRDSVIACTAGACGGDGVRVQTVSPVLLNCVAHGNNGAGLRVTSAAATLQGNVAYANTGDGLSLDATLAPGGSSSVQRVLGNTSAGNQGDGIRLARTPEPPAPLDVVQRNLVANNAGYGMRTTAPNVLTPASLAFNDAWLNSAGDYAGLTADPDSNLAADPLFCSLASGELTLQVGSPCGPLGTFGTIGARGEACPGPAGAPPAAPALAFSLRPNPARGSVEFALPAGIGNARLDVLDLMGRVRWSRTVAAGETTVRWNGTSRTGTLEPGLYWARVSANGFQQRRRLVWLP